MENSMTLFPNPSSSALNFLSTSDDEDHDHHHHHHDPSAAIAGCKNSSSSPWHRMKWSDDIVRLLINIVSYVGDDISPNDASAASKKKGKWKSISKLMLENGFHVSPQQCEDKFNDLNKRYKRLNEILGMGTTCQVVENPSLLDLMNHVSAKAKDDVKKILASKHLFYREMCAYHNGQRIPNPRELELKVNGVIEEEEHDPKDSDESEEDEEEEGEKLGLESLGVEIDGLSAGQKREWFRKRTLQLLEERVEIETEGFELDKRRAKWLRFKSKKDWEMERAWMQNERLMLENQKMALQVRKMEIELDSMKGELGRA